MRRAVVLLAVAALAFAVSGPAIGGEDPPIACTEIGCSHGVSVILKRLPAEARRARVCVAGRCGRSQRLYRDQDGSFVQASLPKAKRRDGARVRVTVRVLDSKGRVLHTARGRANVRRYQPNGSGCPPVCFQAGLRYRGDRARLLQPGA